MTQRYATRLNSFRIREGQKIGAAAALREVAKVKGISAVELNYPQHFMGENEDLLAAARDSGLAVTALNLRYDGPDYAHGAFTHPTAANRDKAMRISMEAAEKAAQHDIDHVILWMGPDGYDYPFQCDYRALWNMEIDGFRRVASISKNVRVSVEYKPSDPRRRSLVSNMGEALIAVADVGLPNFGVTLDYCHLLMAQENPAFAASLALAKGKLFGVHINDGYGQADDGLMVGTVTLWQTVELLWTLKEGSFEGTIYFDTFPDRLDPAAECAANLAMMKRLSALVDRVNADDVRRAQAAQNAVEASRIFHDAVLAK
ncbi:MAG: TIM barrel protein [Rhizobiales bacterium]|nr:TIM barrel protein [Hyphomicrobiales bacterium]